MPRIAVQWNFAPFQGIGEEARSAVVKSHPALNENLIYFNLLPVSPAIGTRGHGGTAGRLRRTVGERRIGHKSEIRWCPLPVSNRDSPCGPTGFNSLSGLSKIKGLSMERPKIGYSGIPGNTPAPSPVSQNCPKRQFRNPYPERQRSVENLQRQRFRIWNGRRSRDERYAPHLSRHGPSDRANFSFRPSATRECDAQRFRGRRPRSIDQRVFDEREALYVYKIRCLHQSRPRRQLLEPRRFPDWLPRFSKLRGRQIDVTLVSDVPMPV